MADDKARPSEWIKEIFDREIAEAERNYEPSPFIDWLKRLRDEVLSAFSEDTP